MSIYKLTEGILKSVESSFMQNYNHNYIRYIVKYKGKSMHRGDKIFFKTEANAKSFVTSFVREIFTQGEYWQEYKNNIKLQTGYDVDYSATISILPQYGLTSRFDLPENKKMFKGNREIWIFFKRKNL